MERFPALRLILRFGRLGAAIVAIAVTALAAALLWAYLGWLAALLTPFILAFVYFLAKSYVEIVQIITEMIY